MFYCTCLLMVQNSLEICEASKIKYFTFNGLLAKSNKCPFLLTNNNDYLFCTISVSLLQLVVETNQRILPPLSCLLVSKSNIFLIIMFIWSLEIITCHQLLSYLHVQYVKNTPNHPQQTNDHRLRQALKLLKCIST